MKCPRCMKPIGPDDKLCSSCNAILIIERKPTQPDEEKGWTLRHFASIAGQAGCAMMIAQNAVVLIAVAAFASRGVEFLQQPNVTPDLTPVSSLGLFANALDLIGLTLVAAALIALGAGAMLLRRRDPFTEEEVALPTRTAAFPMAAGLLVIVWVLLTATWRVVFPADIGRSAAQLLADFAAGGTPVMPASMGLMMGLWVVAAIALFVAALLLGFFGRRLPSKIFAPRSVKTVAWTDFALLNLILTILIALFPSGIVAYRGLEIVYLSILATKLTVLAAFGVLSYWTLLSRFDTFGRLSLMVPVLKAIPQEVTTATAVVEAEIAKKEPPEPTVLLPAPTEDDMRGIEHVK